MDGWMDGMKEERGREWRGLRDLVKVVAEGWVLVILVVLIEIAGLTKQNHLLPLALLHKNFIRISWEFGWKFEEKVKEAGR
ncbi:MAG: hypothetical protein L6R45_09505 [Anaerolineae bacterium]|nr:hypothetical protein [Anaerolineae bacterium]